MIVQSPLHADSLHIVSARIRSIKNFKLPRAFYDSTMGPFDQMSITSLTLRDADGNEGEAPVWHDDIMRSTLFPKLLTEKAVKYPDLFMSMFWSIRNAGFRGPASSALAGVDLALHDLYARKHKKPLHRLLGATRDWALAYGSGGSTMLTEGELIDELGHFVSQGFRTLKMKVGRNFGREMEADIARVKAVRKKVGPKIKIAVDANQVWFPHQALEFANAIAEYDIAWFEEPVHSADLKSMHSLSRNCPIPIAMGESERSAQVFPSLIESGVKHLQPIPQALGSVLGWRGARTLAEQNNLDFSSGGNSWLACQLIATGPETHWTEILIPLIAPLEQLFSIKPKLYDGKFHLPADPGLSCRVDWERMNKEGRMAYDQAFTLKDFK